MSATGTMWIYCVWAKEIASFLHNADHDLKWLLQLSGSTPPQTHDGSVPFITGSEELNISVSEQQIIQEIHEQCKFDIVRDGENHAIAMVISHISDKHKPAIKKLEDVFPCPIRKIRGVFRLHCGGRVDVFKLTPQPNPFSAPDLWECFCQYLWSYHAERASWFAPLQNRDVKPHSLGIGHISLVPYVVDKLDRTWVLSLRNTPASQWNFFAGNISRGVDQNLLDVAHRVWDSVLFNGVGLTANISFDSVTKLYIQHSPPNGMECLLLFPVERNVIDDSMIADINSTCPKPKAISLEISDSQSEARWIHVDRNSHSVDFHDSPDDLKSGSLNYQWQYLLSHLPLLNAVKDVKPVLANPKLEIPENLRNILLKGYGLHFPQNEVYMSGGNGVPPAIVHSVWTARLNEQLDNVRTLAEIGPVACWAEVCRLNSIKRLAQALESLCEKEHVPIPRQIFQRFLFDMSMKNDFEMKSSRNPILHPAAHESRELSRGLIEACQKINIGSIEQHVSRICNSMGRLVKQELESISQQVHDFSAKPNVCKFEVEWKEEGDNIILYFAKMKHVLHGVLVTKLRALFQQSWDTLTSDPAYSHLIQGGREPVVKETLFRWRLFAMVQRYRCLGTDGHSDGRGYHAALSDHIFRFLHDELSTQIECFASPINCFFGHFCSAFTETDSWFGSLGTFFQVMPEEGSFEWNPPFLEDIIEAGVHRLLKSFQNATRPLSVVVVLPNWVTPPTPGIQMLEGAPFAAYRRMDIVRPKGNGDIWIDGFQRTAGRRYFNSNWAGRLFVMQNAGGSERWPIGPDFVKRLLFLFHHGEALPPQPPQPVRVAYATLVMHGDEYVAGAATLAWTLRQHGTSAALVCMVTQDVSESARQSLGGVFDYIVNVPYIRARAIQRRSKRFSEKYYDHWLDDCFTKFNILNPNMCSDLNVKFGKIVFFDADMMAVAPSDSLFEVPTPAGICSAIELSQENEFHGQKVPVELVQTSLKGYGFRGCLLLVAPSIDDYNLVMEILSKGKYGDPQSMIGPDELLATHLFAKRWHHVHRRFGVTAWRTEGVDPVILHFVSEKPWARETKWDDFVLWDKAATALLRDEKFGPALYKHFPPHLMPKRGRDDDDDDAPSGKKVKKGD